MIALNEIISNKDLICKKYKTMSKKANLEKIVKLEEKFIVIDKKLNELRSNCNKLCAEIGQLINNKVDTSKEIKVINSLNNKIISLERKSKSAMNKINAKLKKLPNLSLDDNILNIPLKTHCNELSKHGFIESLKRLASYETSSMTIKDFIKSQNSVVFKAECLPKLIQNKNDFLFLCSEQQIELLDKIQKTLSENAKYLILKSVRYLKKDCSKQFISGLNDGTYISVEYLGEYHSREFHIKFYDKKLDMTQFIRMIRVTVK